MGKGRVASDPTDGDALDAGECWPWSFWFVKIKEARG